LSLSRNTRNKPDALARPPVSHFLVASWVAPSNQIASADSPAPANGKSGEALLFFAPSKSRERDWAAVTHPSQLHDLMAWGGDSSRIVQFSRVITPVEEIQTWNATSYGFSFVISYQSRSGPGLQGNPGFVASWRPVYQNRPAVKVVGSPFKTFTAAEQACEVMLGHLISDSPSSRRAAYSN